MTFGEARSAAHKLVLQLDPEAARKRKEAARGEAHVRTFGPSGPDGSGGSDGPGGPGGSGPGNGSSGLGGPGLAPGAGPASGPSPAALVTITVPWSTLTCECGLAPRCAATTVAANKPKAGGWSSPNRGVLIWHTPAGRRYVTTPTQYPS